MHCDIFYGPRGPFTVEQLSEATARFVQGVHLANTVTKYPDDAESKGALADWCEDLWHHGSMAEQFCMLDATKEEIEAWASETLAIFLKAWSGRQYVDGGAHRLLWPEDKVILVLGGDDDSDPSDYEAWHAAVLLQSCKALEKLGIK
jgi:hypothetical protein